MSQSSKATCLQDLKARILRLDLAPGAELDETQLATRYGLSRTPLREIFQILSGEGYLRLEHNRSAQVATMDLSVARDFFQTAPLLYTATARLAAENRRPDQIPVLKDIQTRLIAAIDAGDTGDAALANHAFHTQIGTMAANIYLQPALVRMLIDDTRLSQFFYRPTSKKEKKLLKKAAQQHDAMIAAIESQTPDLAVDLTLQHWEDARPRLERFLRPDPLPLDTAARETQASAPPFQSGKQPKP